MRKQIYSLRQARKNLPTRRRSDNKTKGGKCLIIAGSSGMWGAAVLCATAAARAGAGYTFLYDVHHQFPSPGFPDFLVTSNKKDFPQFNAVGVGPGVRDKNFLRKCILQFIKLNHPAVVLDAGALDALMLLPKKIQLPKTWILTPHEGEIARLLGVSSQKVKANHQASLLRLQKIWGCIIILKGAGTLIADGRSVFEIQSGNSALAKAGTGDVLNGLITGWLSQGLPAIDAACLGVYVHGAVADSWIKSGNDQLSLLASDLLAALPRTLGKIRKG